MAQPRRTGRPDMRLVALVAAVALAVAVGVFVFLVRPAALWCSVRPTPLP